ncbi:hypothetical protein LR48_Vigan564s001700 [Vigna angularis]|uniref:NAD(P)-binding domain-containing protein n=1 Tax=Phaseolus angularis TaxID=3914 RepID=A0A0L9TDW5_PHAAN|nr:hypothetical protein LR48_Vigan564s001700 [Vigna angularis]
MEVSGQRRRGETQQGAADSGEVASNSGEVTSDSGEARLIAARRSEVTSDSGEARCEEGSGALRGRRWRVARKAAAEVPVVLSEFVEFVKQRGGYLLGLFNFLSEFLFIFNIFQFGVRETDYKTADGTCIRDYIDVTDLVDAHVKALEKAQPAKVGIYNVGTGKGSSVKQFVEACKKATGVDIKVEFLPRRPGDYAEVYSDPRKIKRELDWSAKYTDLQQSLRIAWRWQKSHCDGYGVSNELR